MLEHNLQIPQQRLFPFQNPTNWSSLIMSKWFPKVNVSCANVLQPRSHPLQGHSLASISAAEAMAAHSRQRAVLEHEEHHRPYHATMPSVTGGVQPPSSAPTITGHHSAKCGWH